jgi:xanthosine utilization system XapX-like protein
MIMSDGTTTAMGTIFMLLQVRSPVPAFQFLPLALVSIGW